MSVYYCVLDFEATCWEKGDGRKNTEIIEFPSVLLRDGKVVAEFHRYVRPVIVPELSTFCTTLTGITNDTVNKAATFKDVYLAHYNWLKENTTDKVIIVTCGGWDLLTMLPQEMTRYVDLPYYQIYKNFINIKHEFAKKFKTNETGMAGMLRHLGLPLQGRHHSGIDDARNITTILQRMLEDPVDFTVINVDEANRLAKEKERQHVMQRRENKKK